MFTFKRTQSLDELIDEFNTVFGPKNSFPNIWSYSNCPAPNDSFYRRKGKVIKENDEYIARLALPGFDKEDLKIEFEESYLNVSAEISDEKQTEFVMTFSETMLVSSDVDASKIKAKLENGILEIRMPMLSERKPKKIEIK